MNMLIKEKGGRWEIAYGGPITIKRFKYMAVAATMMSLAACATPAAPDGYASSKVGDAARERDWEIAKLERDRDNLAFAGIKTQADVMKKALISKRLAELYDQKLGRRSTREEFNGKKKR